LRPTWALLKSLELLSFDPNGLGLGVVEHGLVADHRVRVNESQGLDPGDPRQEEGVTALG